MYQELRTWTAIDVSVLVNSPVIGLTRKHLEVSRDVYGSFLSSVTVKAYARKNSRVTAIFKNETTL